jgi:hypothetical protein
MVAKAQLQNAEAWGYALGWCHEPKQYECQRRAVVVNIGA